MPIVVPILAEVLPSLLWVERQCREVHRRLISLKVVLLKHKPAHVDGVDETPIIAECRLQHS
jgi:hypothetical protein